MEMVVFRLAMVVRGPGVGPWSLSPGGALGWDLVGTDTLGTLGGGIMDPLGLPLFRGAAAGAALGAAVVAVVDAGGPEPVGETGWRITNLLGPTGGCRRPPASPPESAAPQSLGALVVSAVVGPVLASLAETLSGWPSEVTSWCCVLGTAWTMSTCAGQPGRSEGTIGTVLAGLGLGARWPGWSGLPEEP